VGSSPVRLSGKIAKLDSSFYVVAFVCLVAALSYLAAALGGVLVLRPQMVWPLWPGCAFLVAVLLLTPQRLWPALLTAGLAGFVLYDARAGLTIRATSWLIVADVIEILIAALGVRYLFGGVPRLTNLKSLAKYSLVAVILAPVSAASFGRVALGDDYWATWGISFLTEALALLTLTPAILSWVDADAWAQESRAYYFEAAALIAGLVILGYITFVASGGNSRPALLYSLVPLLLWSALRFGIKGTINSMLIVAFLSIWGAVHGSGPFTGRAPLSDVLSLQLFLLFAAASFMVLAVLADEHKQSARAVRESEKRFRLVANAAPVLIWLSGPDKLCTYFNKTWLDFTGRPNEQELGNGWAQGVHPQDLQNCLATYTRSFDRRERFRMEYRLRRYDGEYRWILDIGVPRFTQNSFEGYIGIGVDVTEHKLAEEALSHVSRRLIEAQEKERNRIGRDLHDDIGQRLALLAVELHQVKQDLPDSAVALNGRMDQLLKQTSEISVDVQALSHELHSSKLEYLGVVAAMRSFCQEFGDQHRLEITFRSHDLPGASPSPEISLSLFRVLQEALHNASKHSGVRHFEVHLWGMPGELHLSVSDSGAGFDTNATKRNRGIGLMSMNERLKLIKGELSIESQPNRGTTIHACVPFISENDSERAVE